MSIEIRVDAPLNATSVIKRIIGGKKVVLEEILKMRATLDPETLTQHDETIALIAKEIGGKKATQRATIEFYQKDILATVNGNHAE
jgi:hypothetical protein